MENTCEIFVISELIKNENLKFNDEFFFRELAQKMVREMPLEELHKLIKFEKIDPYSDKSEEILYANFNKAMIAKICQLRDNQQILYRAIIKLP